MQCVVPVESVVFFVLWLFIHVCFCTGMFLYLYVRMRVQMFFLYMIANEYLYICLFVSEYLHILIYILICTYDLSVWFGSVWEKVWFNPIACMNYRTNISRIFTFFLFFKQIFNRYSVWNWHYCSYPKYFYRRTYYSTLSLLWWLQINYFCC